MAGLPVIMGEYPAIGFLRVEEGTYSSWCFSGPLLEFDPHFKHMQEDP